MKGELAERLEPKLHQSIAFQEVENGMFASSLESMGAWVKETSKIPIIMRLWRNGVGYPGDQ